MVVSEETRKDAISNKLSRRGENGTEYRLALDGENKVLPVIKISLKNVVLNPRNHRIKAQIYSHPDSDLLRREPYSRKAQEEFSKMLKQTDRYERLKENLRSEGQRQPGVVTRKGLLVNANRRVTALREIEGKQYVRVAVLPEGITPEEILEVESNLQVRENYRAEYTYINQLLLIEEMLNDFGRDEEDVALALGYADSKAKKHLEEGVQKVKKYLKELALIREAQEMSQVDGEPQIDLVFFDDKQQIVSEIVEEYESLKNDEGLKEARRLKRNRLIGLFTEYKYRELRLVDQNFVEDFFLEIAEERDSWISVDFHSLMEEGVPTEEGNGEDKQQDLNLDILGEENNESSRQFDSQPLVELLAQTYGDNVVNVPTQNEGQNNLRREVVVEDTREILNRATDRAREEQKEENILRSPIKRTSEAASKLKKARSKYKEAHKMPSFDASAMKEEIAEVEKRLKELKSEISN